MKYCIRCNKNKELVEFRPNKNRFDGYQSYCKICDKEFQKEWYLKNKEKVKSKSKVSNKKVFIRNRDFVLTYLRSHPCITCGEQDIVVLEFDHLENKKGNISDLIKSYSLKTIVEEINKYQVLCANCHKRKTANDFNWYKNN